MIAGSSDLYRFWSCIDSMLVLLIMTRKRGRLLMLWRKRRGAYNGDILIITDASHSKKLEL